MNTLNDVLHPLTARDFKETTLGRNYLLQSGNPDRYRQLLPWSALNDILATHQLDFPRIRFSKDGTTIPRGQFIGDEKGYPRLKQGEILKLLKGGATLVLDAVDRLYAPLSHLMQDFEREFGEYVQVNAYAGWGRSFGFDLHWDDHEVFVLQVHGRKEWKVYGMSRPFPIKADRKEKFAPPQKPLWEGVLNSGDLLYMPRGWWHVATPMDEPTLHLTVSYPRKTGMEFMSWFASTLGASEVFRRDLPKWEGAGATTERVAAFQAEIAKLLSAERLDEFARHCDVSASSRLAFSLPAQVQEQAFENGPDTCVRLLLPRITRLAADESRRVIEFEAMGRKFSLPIATRPVLEVILSGREHSIAELLDAAGSDLTREEATALLKNLLIEGVIAVVPQPAAAARAAELVEA